MDTELNDSGEDELQERTPHDSCARSFKPSQPHDFSLARVEGARVCRTRGAIGGARFQTTAANVTLTSPTGATEGISGFTLQFSALATAGASYTATSASLRCGYLYFGFTSDSQSYQYQAQAQPPAPVHARSRGARKTEAGRSLSRRSSPSAPKARRRPS